jgi:hypothetical protein
VVDDTLTVIFVDLTGTELDFHIAPAQWVREDVQRHLGGLASQAPLTYAPPT